MDISISKEQAKDFALACFETIMREIQDAMRSPKNTLEADNIQNTLQTSQQ